MENKIFIVKLFKKYKKLILPMKNFKMDFKFFPCPEPFKTKLIKNI